MRGWVLAERGNLAEGLAAMRQGLAEFREAGGASVTVPYHLGLLAETSLRAGDRHEAREMLAEALRVAEQNNEHWWDAELWRLKGELALKQETVEAEPHDDREAERCFRQALTIAQRQGAKSLELRAAMSFFRLHQSYTDGKEARRRMAAIYGSFVEGFQTRDLVEARALLAQRF